MKDSSSSVQAIQMKKKTKNEKIESTANIRDDKVSEKQKNKSHTKLF